VNGVNPMRSEKYVKNYFRKKGTVANWWNPTKDDYVHIYEEQINIIKNWIKNLKNYNCLEVSCGKGRVTKQLSRSFRHYIATDISKEMLAIAKRDINNVKFKIEDAENLSFKSNSFDVVVCLEALVHYPRPENALNEFYRVLKKGGILIIDSDNVWSLRRIFKEIFKYLKITPKKDIGEDIFCPYRKREFISMFEKSGFKIEKFNYLGIFSPIKIRTISDSFYLISPKVSRLLQKIPFDFVPFINKLSTYHLVLARK